MNNGVVSVIGYILCLVFFASLITLVVMMCINEFRRFFDRKKKKQEKVFNDKE